jgi:hypothetical protein
MQACVSLLCAAAAILWYGKQTFCFIRLASCLLQSDCVPPHCVEYVVPGILIGTHFLP